MDVAVVDDGDPFTALRSVFGGELLRSTDDGYDRARRVWNGNIDRRPALVVRCAGVADVQQSVNFAGRTTCACRCGVEGTARLDMAPTTVAW